MSARSRSSRGSRSRGGSRTRVVVVADLGVPGFGVVGVPRHRGTWRVPVGEDLVVSVFGRRGRRTHRILTVVELVVSTETLAASSGVWLHDGELHRGTGIGEPIRERKRERGTRRGKRGNAGNWLHGGIGEKHRGRTWQRSGRRHRGTGFGNGIGNRGTTSRCIGEPRRARARRRKVQAPCGQNVEQVAGVELMRTGHTHGQQQGRVTDGDNSCSTGRRHTPGTETATMACCTEGTGDRKEVAATAAHVGTPTDMRQGSWVGAEQDEEGAARAARGRAGGGPSGQGR